jgi:hypothetical protein
MMDVLSYANPDHDQNNLSLLHQRRPRLSHAAWNRIGCELNATVVPFSFWRSRLRKLLIPTGAWTIAVDEVGDAYKLRGRVLFSFAHELFSFEFDTGASSRAALWIDSSMLALRALERPVLDALFDANCTVLTDSPDSVHRVLADVDIRQQILCRPPFEIRCAPQRYGRGLLTMTAPPGNDVRFAVTSMCVLLQTLLLRLCATGCATPDGVPWTLGV